MHDDVINTMINAMDGNGFPGAKFSDVAEALRAAEKAGWKLVPVEPTEVMKLCGQSHWSDFCRDGLDVRVAARNLYKYMLEAAPHPWEVS